MNSLIKLPIMTLLGFVTLGTVAAAQSICTQSADNSTITVPWATGCVFGGPIGSASSRIAGETAWMRRYSPATDCMAANGVSIGAVHFGIQEAFAGPASNGLVAVEVRLYKIDPMLPLKFMHMDLVHDERLMIPAQTQTHLVAPLPRPVYIAAGYDVVVEVYQPDGFWSQDFFRPGTNGIGETSPTYVFGACTAMLSPDPVTAASLGAFGGNPAMQVILDLEYTPGIGARYCSPATANSTGSAATIGVAGSPRAADNDLTLHGSDFPVGSFAFFLTSMSQGFVAGAGGSQGNLCLGSSIGRYVAPGQIQQAVNGAVSLALDLTQTPTPTGLVSVMGGETWSFQAWYRDTNAGMPTSNFSDAITVAFF
ncbi:MAG: hypothetical protein ACJAZN_003686 [Planctomycetota bacterium]|jgi:hypothetical protein